MIASVGSHAQVDCNEDLVTYPPPIAAMLASTGDDGAPQGPTQAATQSDDASSASSSSDDESASGDESEGDSEMSEGSWDNDDMSDLQGYVQPANRRAGSVGSVSHLLAA